jgi:hypothetical protein
MFLLFAIRSAVFDRLASSRVATVALAVLLVCCCAATRAMADPVAQVSPAADASPAASPAPDTSPAAAPAPAPSPTPAPPLPGGRGSEAPAATIPKSAAKFGHLPTIDIVPWYTDPLFWLKTDGKNGVDPLKNKGVGYQALDVGGTVKVPITQNISFSFDRNIEGTLNVPNAPVTNAEHVRVPNVFARDVVLVSRLDEQFHRLQIEEGLYFRHRVVGGANTSDNPFPVTTNSTEAHFGYIGLTYAFPPIPWLLNSFVTVNINADTQAIDHHVGCGKAKVFASGSFSVPCIDGVADPNPSQNRVWETDQYVQLTIPFDRKRGLVFSAQDRWGALNFYENAAFPYRWTTSQTYFLTKRFNRVFAVSIRNRSQWSVQQGVPYLKPNAQHNGTIDLLADFKVDLNNLH